MKRQSEPLKAAVVGVVLLAGGIVAFFALGALVIALRLLFDHFSMQGAVTAVGQLPRETVGSTALLNVVGPVVCFGLLMAMIYALLGRPRPRRGPAAEDELTSGKWWRVLLLFLGLFAVAVLGTLPALQQAVEAEDVSALLVPCILAIAITFGLLCAGWYWIRRQSRDPDGTRIGRAMFAGGVWAVVAIVPAVMLASAKPFEQAQACTVGSLEPLKGRLIGESPTRIFLEEEFGNEAALVVLPIDQVTRSESGDLSSTTPCPPPPGAKAVARDADDALGGHGSEKERELATALRPYLRFDSAEHWRPVAVDDFVAEKFSGRTRHTTCRVAFRVCLPFGKDNDLTVLRRGPKAPDFVDIDGEPTSIANYKAPRRRCRGPVVWDCNEGRSAVVYYRRTTHEGRWYWDYWWFLRYNDYTGKVNACRIYCADHEGDWEGITVITTPRINDPEIVGAIYAAHKDRVLVDGPLVPLSKGHPIAFVAQGTHASYPFRCVRCSQFSAILGFRLPEEGHDGEAAWGNNLDSECDEHGCVEPLPELAEAEDLALPLAGEWAGWPGRWGATCGFRPCNLEESSPSSPGLQTRFKCPWVPTRWARLAPDGTVSRSDPAGDAERVRALCEAQRAGF